MAIICYSVNRHELATWSFSYQGLVNLGRICVLKRFYPEAAPEG